MEELATVQDALRIFAYARVPAPLLPQPPRTTSESPPILKNINFQPSIGSIDESSKVFMEVSGSVVATTLVGTEDPATAARLYR